MLYGLLLENCARNPYDCTTATTLNVVRNSSKSVPPFLGLLYLFLCNKCTSKFMPHSLKCVLYLVVQTALLLLLYRLSNPYRTASTRLLFFLPRKLCTKTSCTDFKKSVLYDPLTQQYLPRFLCYLAALGIMPLLLQLLLLPQARPLSFSCSLNNE
jgi:hypothetical protein